MTDHTGTNKPQSNPKSKKVDYERQLESLAMEIQQQVMLLETDGQMCLLTHDFDSYFKMFDMLKNIAAILEISVEQYD